MAQAMYSQSKCQNDALSSALCVPRCKVIFTFGYDTHSGDPKSFQLSQGLPPVDPRKSSTDCKLGGLDSDVNPVRGIYRDRRHCSAADTFPQFLAALVDRSSRQPAKAFFD